MTEHNRQRQLFQEAQDFVRQTFGITTLESIEARLHEYPLPAISPTFREAAESMDLYARDADRRFVLRKASSLVWAHKPEGIIMPDTQLLPRGTHALLDVPSDSLYIDMLNWQAGEATTEAGHAGYHIRTILEQLSKDIEFSRQITQQYGETTEAHQLMTISVQNGQIIFLG